MTIKHFFKGVMDKFFAKNIEERLLITRAIHDLRKQAGYKNTFYRPKVVKNTQKCKNLMEIMPFMK